MYSERAFVVLTPYESRRLIAKAIVRLPSVEEALQNGWIVVATGSTTCYVAEELLGQPMVKENFISGHITLGETWSTLDNPDFIFPIVLHKGIRQDIHAKQALEKFSAKDVFIKGANAVDNNYHAAIFMANDEGGTIGSSLGTLYARGAQLVMPVGLEKMIPSVEEAVKHTGNKSYRYSTGSPAGLMPIVQATVVTEIQALSAMFDVQVYHVGSGGIAGSEGAVVLVIEGKESNVTQAFEFVQSLKGEKNLLRPHGTPKQ
ncbi:hypothetical protein [Sporomusa acidovorans]|uniref:Uncharacterized protein n=1 Tax=Sporomusa acidovorans (strain ATCC 49682 / DSM 3132 / Mol) TaxID=1123286 RepID=A0ABZ3IY95_SPOA4|nr:hypothetical protein [Sporomusa acidovorans]OZC15857.1 hypothetical protein SPACI_46780 [Sporomusa acidovorans DSM 3132]SDF29239.1 hypothetical protein SAMN04488499_10423 [Sporomusa acidovorans]